MITFGIDANTGSKIKELRLKKGYSRRELAKIANVSESTIKQYENGSRKPQFYLLNQIATALGVTIDYFGLRDQEGRTVAETEGELNALFQRVSKALCGDEVDVLYENEAYVQIKKLLGNLNDIGKLEAVKRIEELTLIPRYSNFEQENNSDNPVEKE